MRQLLGSLGAIVLSVASASAQGAQPAPAPAPGSPATYKSAADLAAVLAKANASAAGMKTSAISNTDQYRVNIVHRDRAAGALAHAGNTELLYILEGSGTIVTGGTIVPAADGKPASIANGISQAFAKGDVVIVPPGSAHWFAKLDAPVTYLEVRWVAPASANPKDR